MTYDEIIETIKKVNTFNGLELYKRSETINVILEFNNGGLSAEEFNLMTATKLIVEHELEKRGSYEG